MDSPYDHVPATIGRYLVPRPVLADTVRVLREQSAGRREAVVLWQGRVLDWLTAEVTRLLVPRQDTGPLHFNVPLEERLRILAEVSGAEQFILIQLHTHPREAFHSEADDRLAITKHTGAISVVVADFGTRWTGDFRETSVNQSLGGGLWRELSEWEVTNLFEVTG